MHFSFPGKFDKKTKNESDHKVKKRKNLMKGDEKLNNMRVMTKILGGHQPQVDKNKAAKHAIAASQKKKQKTAE